MQLRALIPGIHGGVLITEIHLRGLIPGIQHRDLTLGIHRRVSYPGYTSEVSYLIHFGSLLPRINLRGLIPGINFRVSYVGDTAELSYPGYTSRVPLLDYCTLWDSHTGNTPQKSDKWNTILGLCLTGPHAWLPPQNRNTQLLYTVSL
jgi:hypothetical protein